MIGRVLELGQPVARLLDLDENMSKVIKLSKGKATLVDDEDFNWLSRWRWHFNSNGYAQRVFRIKQQDNKVGHVYLHHEVIGKPNGNLRIDHINRNKLDNRKSNLRFASDRNNSHNTMARTSNKLKIKGVYWDRVKQRYCTQITVNYKRIHIGSYKVLDDAIIAYNSKALKYFGAFAYLNKL